MGKWGEVRASYFVFMLASASDIWFALIPGPNIIWFIYCVLLLQGQSKQWSVLCVIIWQTREATSGVIVDSTQEETKQPFWNVASVRMLQLSPIKSGNIIIKFTMTWGWQACPRKCLYLKMDFMALPGCSALVTVWVQWQYIIHATHQGVRFLIWDMLLSWWMAIQTHIPTLQITGSLD